MFIAILVAAAALSVTFSLLLAEKYEAKVTLRSATVAQTVVESNTQTLARLAAPRFYTQEVITACGRADEDAQEYFVKAIKSSAMKLTTDLTAISYTGKGKEQTQVCLAAVVTQLARAQDELAQSRKKLLGDQLSLRRSELLGIEKLELDLQEAVKRSSLASKSPAEVALYLSALVTRRNQTDELRRMINDMAASLEAPSTQKLSALEPIYVSSKPVFPNPFLFGFAGLFIGLLVCALFCWRELAAILSQSDEN